MKPSAHTEWSKTALEEFWDYLCVTLDIVGDKKKLDLIRKFVELKIKQERTRLLSVESMKMETKHKKCFMSEDLACTCGKYVRNKLRQSILSEMEK